jgi:purine-binding chemotaxis protein CheW
MYQETTVDKFIVFKIMDSLLAMPMSDVLKVVSYPPIDNEGLRAMGLVQLGRHTLRVLDLHQQLSPNGLTQLPRNPGFLVITRSPQGEVYGIAVDEPPNLMELPSEIVQNIPQSDRQLGGLEMVSHAAILSQEDVKTTILLLDARRFPYSS